jgi:hypothetical protein
VAAADCGGWAVLPPQTSCLRQSPSKPQAGSCPLTVLLRCLPCASLLLPACRRWASTALPTTSAALTLMSAAHWETTTWGCP